MKDKDQESTFNPRFKAKLALEAFERNSTIAELASKHKVSEEQLGKWTERLKRGAEILFLEQEDMGIELPGIDDEDMVMERLRNYLYLLRTTLDSTVNGILVVDLEGRIVLYNERFLEMWNISEEVMRQGEDEKAISHVLEQLKDPGGFQLRIEHLYHNPASTSKDWLEFKDGRVFERYSFPHKLGNEIVGRVWSFMDVTESRRAEEELNRFSQLLSSINKNVEQGILRSTPQKGLIYVNEAFVKMFGYDSKEEALQTKPEQFYADPEQDGHCLN